MPDETDEIRARIDIVDLVGQSVSLQRKGKEWKGLCPFHQDKNPSFTVSSEMGRYRCWACGEHGDIFTWVMKTQHVPFPEAVQILAKQAGVELKGRSKADAAVRLGQRDAMEASLRFFREQLTKSKAARDYCERRGLDGPVRDEWEIGYSPEVGEALAIHLKKTGFKLQDCKELFLVDGDAQLGFHDKFRNRLMFPIRDERGDIVGFGGRAIGDAMPKYINSSDTPLYKKSRVLYGFNRAKEAVRSVNRAVLVEGYLDVIACHRAGVQSAVASLGTALSEDHAKLLKRWCDAVTILYDADAAGEKAAHRAAEILAAADLRVRVALMPPGEDPDTLLRNSGAAAVVRAVDGALSTTEFLLQALDRRLSVEEESYWQEAAEIVATAATETERMAHIEKLAGRHPRIRDFATARKALSKMVGEAARTLRTPANGQPAGRRVTSHLQNNTMSKGETFVFRGVLSPELRELVWRTALDASLFESAPAVEFSIALAQTFGANAPEGMPSSWLHLMDDHAQEIAMEIQRDQDLIDEVILRDVIRVFEEKREKSRIDLFKGKEKDNSELEAIQRAVRQLKPT